MMDIRVRQIQHWQIDKHSLCVYVQLYVYVCHTALYICHVCQEFIATLYCMH